MATFRSRLPAGRDVALVFAACAVPIHSWSVLAFLKRMADRWVLFLDPWDLAGVFAYAQAFAFLESAAVLLVLVLVSLVLPARLLRRQFASRGSTLALLAVAFAVALQFALEVGLSPLVLPGALALYAASGGVGCAFLSRHRQMERLVCAFVERLVVLATVYTGVALASFVVVVLRNV